MLGSLLLLASATATFISHNFRGKKNFCTDIETALLDDVAGDRIVVPTDGAMYLSSVQQYAYSSMPNGTLHPSAVVYAETTREVQKIVSYATTCGYTIAVRSGGHQYSGLSSCNSAVQKCLQVDLSLMASVAVGETTAVVGPGVTLASLYTTLAEQRVFVPAAECDTVAVGGHAQTGGAGIYARSFGFFADHVVAFEIVLASGTVRRVTKPTGDAKNPSFNDLLFWAVLGGNAGSWGVATSYELMLRRDVDYPHSTQYACAAPWSKEVYAKTIRVLNEMVSSDEWAMDTAGDESAFISVGTREPMDFNIILVKGVWTGVSGKPFNSTYYGKFVAAAEGTGAQCGVYPMPMSVALRDFVVLGRERELPLPFATKVSRGTEGAVGEDALELLASRIDESMTDRASGVYRIHQIGTFGGATNTAENRARSPIPYRNYPIIATFDAFYLSAVNPNAKANAIAGDDKMWDSLLLTDTFKRDRRVTWCMFGDLNIQNTYQFFWDTPTYLKLKGIKTLADPTEVFRSPFTIPSFVSPGHY